MQDLIQAPRHIRVNFQVGVAVHVAANPKRPAVHRYPLAPMIGPGDLDNPVAGIPVWLIASHEFRNHLAQIIEVAGLAARIVAPVVGHTGQDHALAESLRLIGHVRLAQGPENAVYLLGQKVHALGQQIGQGGANGTFFELRSLMAVDQIKPLFPAFRGHEVQNVRQAQGLVPVTGIQCGQSAFQLEARRIPGLVVLALGSILEVRNHRPEVIAGHVLHHSLHALALFPVPANQAIHHVRTGWGEELRLCYCLYFCVHWPPPQTNGALWVRRFSGWCQVSRLLGSSSRR